MKLKFLYLLPLFLVYYPIYCSFRSDINNGNKLFYKKDYEKALEKYNSAEIRKPDSPIVYYNRANNFYKQQLYNDALNEYQRALGLTKDKNLKSKILYNMGNTFLKLGDTQKAKDAYTQGLLLNPKDEDIKYNLQYALINLNQNQSQNQQKDKQNNQQNQQQQKKDKEQNQQKKYMSEQDIQRLIESVNQQQKDKLKEALKPAKPKLPEVDKDW